MTRIAFNRRSAHPGRRRTARGLFAIAAQRLGPSVAPRGERGSVTLAAVVGVIAMIVLVGLAVDGGGQVYARQHAHDVAREAARTAGQHLQAGTIRGGTVRTDPAAAARAARRYLNDAGMSGTVTVTGQGTASHIRVTATTGYDTVFLGLIGITRLEVAATADARPVRALAGDEQ